MTGGTKIPTVLTTLADAYLNLLDESAYVRYQAGPIKDLSHVPKT